MKRGQGQRGKNGKLARRNIRVRVRAKVIVIISFWEVQKRSRGRLVLNERKENKGKINTAVKRQTCKVVSL